MNSKIGNPAMVVWCCRTFIVAVSVGEGGVVVHRSYEHIFHETVTLTCARGCCRRAKRLGHGELRPQQCRDGGCGAISGGGFAGSHGAQ